MSGSRPYFKFFVGNWNADAGLKSCSLAARGLWIELLTLMHDAKPYGHLLVAGKRPTVATLAGVVNAPVEQVAELLDELKRNDVYSVNHGGTIYSRKMVRDAVRSATAARSADARWNKESGESEGQSPVKVQNAQTDESIEHSRPRNAYSIESRVHSYANTGVLARSKRASGTPARRSINGTGLTRIRSTLATVLSRDSVAALIEHRQELKSPLTVRAAELLAPKYAAAPSTCGLSPDQAVDFQIAHGWKGFDPEWVINAARRDTARSPPTARADTFDRAIEQMIASGKGAKHG